MNEKVYHFAFELGGKIISQWMILLDFGDDINNVLRRHHVAPRPNSGLKIKSSIPIIPPPFWEKKQ
jgi:hypothetical protein